MIQDDQDQMCSNNSNEGGENSVIRSSTSKKLKQKVPQRGLGVAQLEKIRIEEQQKKDAKFSPTLNSPPSPPLPSVASNFAMSSPLFRAHSVPDIENIHNGLNPPTNGRGFRIGWDSFPIHKNINSVPKSWGDHELVNERNGENSMFLRDLSLPYETCPVAPSPEIVSNGRYYHHQQSSTSLVNNNGSTSNNCSSMPNFALEPSSNQNGFNNYVPSWIDDQKVMFGTKRSRPFPVDDPPIPIFRNTFTREDSRPCQNGATLPNFDPPIFRNFGSSPSTTHELTTNLRKRGKSQIGNSNESSMLLASNNTQELRNFKALPCQESFEDAQMELSSQEEAKCISLFPSTKLHATSQSNHNNNNNGCNCELGENIDLNLRL